MWEAPTSGYPGRKTAAERNRHAERRTGRVWLSSRFPDCELGAEIAHADANQIVERSPGTDNRRRLDALEGQERQYQLAAQTDRQAHLAGRISRDFPDKLARLRRR